MDTLTHILNGFAVSASSGPVGAQSHGVENVAPNGIVHHVAIHLIALRRIVFHKICRRAAGKPERTLTSNSDCQNAGCAKEGHSA